MDPLAMFFTGAIGLVSFVILCLFVYASRIQTVGPNEVLVISGRPNTIRDAQGLNHEVGFRIVKGGRAFVFPIIEKYDKLSLEIMTLEIQTPEVVTKQGVPILVDGVAQIKVKGEDIAIITAAEQFLGKSKSEIMGIAHQTLEGHLRAILGTMDVEELISNRDSFARNVQSVVASDLANMGMAIVAFTIKDIRDKQGYLESLGKKAIAERQRDAAIGQAMAQRDAEISRAQATSQAVEESSKFNKQAQVTKMGNDLQVSLAHRDFQMKQAEFQAAVNQKKAEADRAYDLQKFKTDQLVKAEEIQITVIEKQKAIEVQEQEIGRKEKELIALVQRPAEAEKRRVELLATAEQFKLKATAEGESESTRMKGLAKADVERAEGTAGADVQKARGLADADVLKAKGIYEADVSRTKGLYESEVIKARGLAEAESRRAIGLAEAEAMEKKATAWKSYSDAAVTQMFVDKLPEIVRAVSDPLSKTEKIIMISNGDGGVGASKLTKEVIDVVTQVPPMLEAMTGVNLKGMIDRIGGEKRSGQEGKAPQR
ncbi:MAG: flotillin family protein [Candidatus Riflebacteria bacterium]|nr:flotillin family protein [Candidatus Riflebacteria bacterium]